MHKSADVGKTGRAAMAGRARGITPHPSGATIGATRQNTLLSQSQHSALLHCNVLAKRLGLSSASQSPPRQTDVTVVNK